MIIKANINMGLRSLLGAKQRTLLALLGIVIGIGSVIAMVSVGIIVQAHSLKQFTEMGTDYIVVSKGWGGGSGESAPKITLDQAVELPQRVSSILEATPMASSGTNFTYEGQSYSAQILATMGNFLSINRFKMNEGRYISDLDINMNYCVLGSDIVAEMKEKGVTTFLGIDILFRDRLFKVVGLLDKTPLGGLKPFNANRSIMIPISTFMRTFEDPEISNILARMKPGAIAKEASEDVKNYFRLVDPALQIEVQNAEELIQQMEKQSQMFTLLLGAIGSISLIVGGVGVMNVMLVSVSERKKEIGIRRALGALRRDIQLQFLIESLVLCLIGGLIGLIMGIGVSYFIAKHNQWDFMVSNIAIVLGVGVSTAIGLFFGYYPARQASMLDPIVALRS